MAEEPETNERAMMDEPTENEKKKKMKSGAGIAIEEEPSPVAALEFQASQVISRLEEAVERAAEGGGATWNDSSGFLSQPKTAQDILALVQDLVIHEAPRGPEDVGTDGGAGQIANLPPLTEAAKLALVAQSVSAYAAALPRQHAQRLAGRLAADATRWLSHIFHFVDCASSFHEDHLEGLVRVTRLAIHRKYPRYMEEGFAALAASPPLVYSSIAAPLGIGQHLCRQLSLPLHCVRPIPNNSAYGARNSMDVSALERRLAEDSQTNSGTPLLVLAEAGSVLTGHCDNITRLREICDKYNVWLHLRGHSMAVLALTNFTTDLPSKIADSITLPLGVWLGIPSLPVVTLYRLTDSKGGRPTQRDTTLSLVSGLMTDSLSRRLPTLPLWATLQILGREGIEKRFRRCFLVVEELYNEIQKLSCISILSQPPGGETGTYSLNDISSNVINGPQIFQVVASALVFQFVPSDRDPRSGERVPPYYDKLNTWLGQILQRDMDNLQIELCEIEQHGVAIRICPLENPESPPTEEDVENVVACLEQQIEILLATVEHKETFVRLVTDNDCLRFVDVPGWTGLGGVRYVPATWINVMNDRAKDDLNRLNVQLVETLRSTDAAFSLGEGPDGLACVQFGMVTQDADVAELLSLVIQVGQEVEASSKLLDTMSEVVKRGIEAAQTDLERENAEKLWQEGILRHVPVVGTFVNWWSPPSKEAGVRGRSLNLQAGVVESTENIYKYHMQLQPNSTTSNGSGARTPPQPLVQTPVGAGSQSHSRSSSHSSLQSAKSNLPTINDPTTQPQSKESLGEMRS